MKGARLAGVAVVGALVLAPMGFLVSDRLEQDDAFCISCHLPSGSPLHEAKVDDFRGSAPVSLVVAHALAGNDARPDAAFRCIDCHGGVGLAGRLRVKLLSVKDAFWYATGRFDEPEVMHWPLWDRDCTQCHDAFPRRAARGEEPLFHELAEHNTAMPVRCVACHLAHDRGALVDFQFLHAAPVRAQCAQCHLELEEVSR